MSVGPDLKAPRRPVKRGKGPLWFLLGCVATVILIVLFPKMLHGLKQVEHTTIVKAQSLQHRITSHRQKDDKSLTKLKLDFYQLLTRSSQVLTKSESAEVEHNPPTNTTPSGAQYIIQVASFRRKSDANSLKAQLALWGIVANVQSVTIKHENWERVRVGPIGNVAEVDTIRHRLISHQLHPLLIKLKHK